MFLYEYTIAPMPIGLFCECKKTKNLQHKNKNKSKVFYAPIQRPPKYKEF